MIRDAVLHLENEQPLVADIYRLPEPTDVGLLCTNLRTLDGRRPVSVDDSRSVFFFPYRVLRFVEVRPSSAGMEDEALAAAAAPEAEPEPAGDLELDEELLRRVREV